MVKSATAARSYVIFGPGRAGKNIAAWVALHGHRATLISRAEAKESGAKSCVASADVVCAAIPDSDLGPWAQEWRGAFGGKPAIHFSGALLLPGLWSYHPLYSFPASVLPAQTLNAIAFARQEGAPPLAQLFPGAENPDFVIADADRAHYHALAVLSGNFAAAIWNETAKALSARTGLDPGRLLAPYLAGIVDRFAETPFNSLTGPVARRDAATVEKNLAALSNAPRLGALYEAFLALSWPDFPEK